MKCQQQGTKTFITHGRRYFILHSLEATVLITVLDEQPNTDNCLNPIKPIPSLAMQSLRIREGLWSVLLYYQTQVIVISRFGKPFIATHDDNK